MALRLFESFDCFSGVDAHRVFVTPFTDNQSDLRLRLFTRSGLSGMMGALSLHSGLGYTLNYPSYSRTCNDVIGGYYPGDLSSSVLSSWGEGMNIPNFVSGRNGGFAFGSCPTSNIKYYNGATTLYYTRQYIASGYNGLFFSRDIIDNKTDFFITFDWGAGHLDANFPSGGATLASYFQSHTNAISASALPARIYGCGPFSIRIVDNYNYVGGLPPSITARLAVCSGLHILTLHEVNNFTEGSFQYAQIHHILDSGNGMFEFKLNGSTIFSESGINTLQYITGVSGQINYSLDQCQNVFISAGAMYSGFHTTFTSALGINTFAIDNLAVWDTAYPQGRPYARQILPSVSSISSINSNISGSPSNVIDSVAITGDGLLVMNGYNAEIGLTYNYTTTGIYDEILGVMVRGGGVADAGANTGYAPRAILSLSGVEHYPSGTSAFMANYPSKGGTFSFISQKSDGTLLTYSNIKSGDIKVRIC